MKAKQPNKKQKQQRPQTHKTVLYRAMVGVLLVISVCGVALWISSDRAYRDYKKQVKLAQNAVFLSSDAVPGAACAMLTKDVAQQLVGGSLQRASSNISLPVEQPERVDWWHADSCRYSDSATSAIYAELFITTYALEDTAVSEFDKKLPLVNEAVEQSAKEFGVDKLWYDGGVHYALKGQQIIEVSASRGTTASQQELSATLLRQMLEKLPPLNL